MIVVVHCLQVWRVYLLGTKFIVKMDNVANTYFQPKRSCHQGKLDGRNLFKNMILSGNISWASTIKWRVLLAGKR